jgi:hypothetical protein
MPCRGPAVCARHAVVLLSIAALLTACAVPPSPPVADSVLSEDEIRPFAEFVRRHTGYELDPLPRVLAVGRARIQAATRDMAAVHGQANAAYIIDGKARTVYLSSPRFALTKDVTSGDLIHELTHHGQSLALRTGGAALAREKGWNCARAMEREAMEIQNRWVFELTGRLLRTQAVIDRASECDPAFMFEARSEPLQLRPYQLREFAEWLERKILYSVYPLPDVIVDRQQFSREARIDIDSTMDVVMYVRRDGRQFVLIDNERFALGNRFAESHLVRVLFLNALANAIEHEGARLAESKGWQCPRAALREALDIQNEWLREKVGGKFISEDTISVLTQCAPDARW